MVDGYGGLKALTQGNTLVQNLYKGCRWRSSLYGKQVLHQGPRQRTSRTSVYIEKCINRLGYKLVFESNRCIIFKNSVYVGRCYLVMNIFKLCWQSCNNLVLNVIDEFSPCLWNNRLSLVDFKENDIYSPEGYI